MFHLPPGIGKITRCLFQSILTGFNFRVTWLFLAIGATAFSLLHFGTPEVSSSRDKGRKHPEIINYDIRFNGGNDLERLLRSTVKRGIDLNSAVRSQAFEQAVNINRGIDKFQKENPTAEVSISEFTGAAEIVRSDSSLTGPNYSRSGIDIVREFIGENRQLYGLGDAAIDDLHFVGESVNEVSGLRLVIVEQMLNGRLVFQSDTRFSLDRDGRVLQSVGNLIPNAESDALSVSDLISPKDALRLTMARSGVELDTSTMRSASVDNDELNVKVSVDEPRITGDVTSRLVYFPIAPGVVVPAWSQIIWSKDADYYALADARDGTLLWRKNIRSDASTHQARFRVYVQADGTTPADNPAPLSPTAVTPGSGFQPAGIAPSIVNMLTAQNITASPNGWIDDCPIGGCTVVQTQTIGNNTLVCLDADVGAGNVCDLALDNSTGMPTGNPDANSRNRDFLGTAPRDFQTAFLPPPQGGPETGQAPGSASFRRGAITQMFYVTNWFHDRLYTYGFTPAARNFQNNTFGGGGSGNDRVLVDAQDGQALNNANFATPPDGTAGRAQMFIFSGPTVDRDGGLDSEILIHELAHGLSNRLVGNAAGLQWDVGAGMGEGWSDFYALSLLNNTASDDPNGSYASGAYATYKLASPIVTDNYLYGIRRFPYSTVNTVNPLTWADVDDVTNNLSGGITPSPLQFNNGGALEVHNSGEIWANSLWEMRSRIIADPSGANGNVPTGNNTSLSIVTDAMRLFTPNQPSFIQGRNALIDADCAANACANEQWIWEGFADRGLGYGAIAPLGHIFGFSAGHMGVGESFEVPNLDINTVTVNDSVGNSSGALDPNEPALLRVNVRNPWRNAAKGVASATATLTSSTPGVTILGGGTASYPAIAANSNANPTADFVLRAPEFAACGSSVNFTLTLNSSLGTVVRNFKVRIGVPSGTGAPVTFTRDPAPNIAIPDNAPRGVGDSITIADDLEIADLNFRMDSLTHTFTGDLTVMLKGPNGYGTDLISAIGGLTDGGPGDNMTNLLVDQTAASPNDLLVVTSAAAPYTGDWLPIFNGPGWSTAGFPTDPVGQLSRFNGLSTAGTWNLRVSDQFAGDVGTLNQWSIIVTPQAFVCTAFIPTAAGIDISGRVLDANGRPVSRSVVTLTNSEGVTRTTRANSFGNYRIEGIRAGDTYSISVTSKGFEFAPLIVTPNDNLYGLDLIAQP